MYERESIPEEYRQRAYKDGVPTNNNVKVLGSSVPDAVDPIRKILFEAKNYNLNNISGLIRNVVNQVNQRITNLPNFTQKIYIDVRGQEYNQSLLNQIKNQILERVPSNVNVIIEFLE